MAGYEPGTLSSKLGARDLVTRWYGGVVDLGNAVKAGIYF